jgi:lysophospholipase L1-like esterase
MVKGFTEFELNIRRRKPMNRFINLQRRISIGIAVLSFFMLTAFAGAQIKIMPLGDSITRGVVNLTPTDNDSGYRVDLQRLLTAASVDFDFVGRLSHPVSGATFDANHEGHNGQRADQVLGQINTILNTNVPDVVLLHVGTNDVSNGDANSGTILEISQIVDAIKNKNANTNIILASLVPRADETAKDDNTSALNTLIEDLVQSKRGAGVNIWYAGINEIFKANANWATEYFTVTDGVHPNDAGYGIMAQVFLDLILISEGGTNPAITDNFERSNLGTIWHSDSENSLQNGDLLNTATAGNPPSPPRWNYMSTYRNQKNPNRVAIKWSTTADAAGIANGGLALLLNDPTRTADGYLAYITPADNMLRLWTINNGNTDQDTNLEKLSTAAAPQPGDVFRVDVTAGASLQFEYFVNDVSGGVITVNNPPPLPSSLYAGVIFNHSQANDVEEFSIVKFSDTNAPAAITNLATGNTTATSVALTWTAVGDDGLDGQAASYDLRFSTSNITEGNFNSATQVTSVSAPGASGVGQAHTVGGLVSGTTYFFAIKAKDEAGNAGTISNVVSASTSQGNVVADNFDRATLGPNWTATAGYQTVDNELSNTSASDQWSELAIYNARKNPLEVSFTWADDADALGIDQAGFAVVVGSASPTSSGYVISRRNPTDQLRLWNVVNGAVTTPIHIFGDQGGEVLNLTDPVAGDVVRVAISIDPDGNHFDFYKNDEFDARVTDPAFTYDLTQDHWAGVALRANNPGSVVINNDIDDFQLLLTPTPPSALELVSGDLQSGPVGQQLPVPFVVRLVDENGGPVAGANINFAVTAGAGSLDVAPPSENIVIEGEVGSLTAPMVQGNDGLASGGKFIHVPDGTGGAGTGKATYSFNVEVAGNYIMWGRAITPDVNGDVFNIKMDTGQEFLWDVGQRAGFGQPWFWDQVSHRGTGSGASPQINPVVFNLSAGIHTLTIREGKDGVKLDQFFLTRDTNFVPTNIQQPGGTFTDAAGEASATLTLGPQPIINSVEARFGGLTPVIFTATGTAGPPTTITKVSGDNQNNVAAPGAPLPNPFVVELRDAQNNLNLNYPVTFTVISGNGTMGTPNPVNTDPVTGRAQNALTLATDTGINQVQVTAEGYVGPAIIFNASPTPGNPDSLKFVAGNNQTGTAGLPLAQPFQVRVTDALKTPVPNYNVTFTVTGGGGKFGAINQATVQTDAQGIASATMTLGPTPGAANTAQATATFQGTPLKGSPVNFSATSSTPQTLQAVSPLSHNGTANLPLADSIRVRVRDAQNNPLPNYPVNFTVTLGAGKVNGSDNINVNTDVNGIAKVQWRLGSVAGQNNNKILASATFNSNPLAGSPIEFTASAGTAPAAILVKVSGDEQSGLIQNPLEDPFVVRVTDASNNVVVNWPVEFEVTAGGGNFEGSTTVTRNTNDQGLASATLTLGINAGTPQDPLNNVVQVSSENNAQQLQGSPQTFRASAVATGARFLDLVAGGNQTGQASLPLAQKIQVKVTDIVHTNPISSHPVTFRISAGGGTIDGTAAGDTVKMKTTNASGIAEVTWYMGGALGGNNQKLRVTANDGINPLTGSPLEVLATATTGPVDLNVSTVVSDVATVLANGSAFANITVTLTDKFNNPISGKAVILSSTGSNNFITQPTNLTDAEGKAQGRIASTSSGLKTITARNVTDGVDLISNAQVQFIPLEPRTVVMLDGNNQTANIGTAVENPIRVRVVDINNNPVAGIAVDFEVTGGGGFIITETAPSGNSLGKVAAATATNDQGVASATWVLGGNVGANSGRATASFGGNPLTGSPVNFSATGKTAVATRMELFGGFPQTDGEAGKSLPIPLQVKVTDAEGKAVAGTQVNYTVLEGGGSLGNENPVSDYRGIAETTFRMGNTVGLNRARATNASLTGSPINFEFQSVEGPPAILERYSGHDGSGPAGSQYAIAVRITDLFANPIAGVHAGFQVLEGGATIQGSANQTTDPAGFANVQLQLPTTAGTVVVKATSNSLPGFYKLFEIHALAGAATTLSMVSGDNQEGTIGRELVLPLKVKVSDTHGNAVSGFNVPWVVTIGNGSLASAQSTTDVNGFATNELTIGNQPGNNEARAVTALTPSQAVFTATGVTNRFPLFVDLTDKSVVEGSFLTFQVLAEDDDNDPITYSEQDRPSGASFNVNSRTFSWQPTIQQSGVYNVTFIASDDKGGSDVEIITITVINNNHPPVITASTPTNSQLNVLRGVSTAFSVTATDEDSDPLTYRWDIFTDANPNGTLVSTSPQFNFNSDQFAFGTYLIQVEVSDGQDKVTKMWTADVLLSVELSNFAVQIAGFDGAKISWTTIREIDNSGFNVLRSFTEKGEYVKLNDQLIESEGNGEYAYFDRNVEVGQMYFYKLEDVSISGLKTEHGPIAILVAAPETFELGQNYPNPFNPETKIRFQLPGAGQVVLKIYDLLGREVRTLVDDRKGAGYHVVQWDARDNFGQQVSSGVYYYQIIADQFRQTKRMLLLR